MENAKVREKRQSARQIEKKLNLGGSGGHHRILPGSHDFGMKNGRYTVLLGERAIFLVTDRAGHWKTGFFMFSPVRTKKTVTLQENGVHGSIFGCPEEILEGGAVNMRTFMDFTLKSAILLYVCGKWAILP